MQSLISTPLVKRLVLLGGGHSHLSVLMHLARNPVPGLETVLISRDVHTPYSGALPGFIAGAYEFDDIHIDLRPLAQMAGARLINAEVNQLDLENKRVFCNNRPAIRFDILSINIGSSPNASMIPGAKEYAVGVKPIDNLLARWAEIKSAATQKISAGESYAIVIVGGGPASVELAFSCQRAIHKAAGIKSFSASNLHIKIVTADSQLLLPHNNRVREFVHSEMVKRGIEVICDHRVTRFLPSGVTCENEREIPAEAIFYATGASIPTWPAQSGLSVNADGFIAVNNYLQTLSHPYVFACGDAAAIENYPRPKSGVYAVRQGMPLARNLLAYATGKKLKAYFPQKHALALMYTGDGKAIASRANRFFKGRWVWAWKNKIDRDFVRKYTELRSPTATLELARGLTDRKSEAELRQHALRCAGCAAKVGSSILAGAIGNLDPFRQTDIVSSGSAIEDATLIQLDSNRMLVQSVDYFRAFINDPWLFGRIATNHCLSDIYAMGATPHSALAIASIPFAAPKIMRETLSELMAGSVEILNQHGTSLAGGHSNEALELGFGLSVNGFARPDQLLPKSGLKSGDELILCKPLGTGTLLAADMRLKAKGRWVYGAFEQMLVSNREAALCLQQFGATACTDITGFGLAGHLMEMLGPTDARAELKLDSLPVLQGALECLEQNVFSSLHSDNAGVRDSIEGSSSLSKGPLFELLFDPQTAGGLLGALPSHRAADCLQALHDAGYAEARRIGKVVENQGGKASIVLI